MNDDTKPLPFRQSLFWDTEQKNIDTKKNSRYIIERMLDFGNDKEIEWLFANYSKTMIQEVLYRPRSVLHNKSKALWSLMLHK